MKVLGKWAGIALKHIADGWLCTGSQTAGIFKISVLNQVHVMEICSIFNYNDLAVMKHTIHHYAFIRNYFLMFFMFLFRPMSINHNIKNMQDEKKSWWLMVYNCGAVISAPLESLRGEVSCNMHWYISLKAQRVWCSEASSMFFDKLTCMHLSVYWYRGMPKWCDTITGNVCVCVCMFVRRRVGLQKVNWNSL